MIPTKELKALLGAVKDMKPVSRELLEQFGLTADTDFSGLPVLAAALYLPLEKLRGFLETVYALEVQISGLVETLNTYFGGAESAIEKGLKILTSVPQPSNVPSVEPGVYAGAPTGIPSTPYTRGRFGVQ